MKNIFKNDHVLQQIGQSFIVASVLGAVLALGTACSPVTPSMSKYPPRRDGNTGDKRGTNGSSFVSSMETHVVSESEFLETTRALPQGLIEFAPSQKQIRDLQEQGSTIVRLEVAGAVELHTVLEVAQPSEWIETKSLKDVKVAWLVGNPKAVANPQSVDFYVSLASDKDEKAVKTMMKHLKGFTVYYRELK